MTAAANPWDNQLRTSAATDVGMRRSNNQDAHAVVMATDAESFQQRGHLFLVCDGMGAHAAGELASKLAVDGVSHLYHKYREMSAPEALRRAILETNFEVNRRGQANADFHNMGTTCTSMVLLPQGAMFGHVGDSRAYRLRGEQIEQLTFDHSLVWEMRASGQVTSGNELSEMIPKNVITRSLGPNANVQVDLEGPFPTEVGDTFLLCSDGLTARCDDTDIAVILATQNPKEATRLLVDLANLRGGPDNITIVVAKVINPQMTTAACGAEPIVIGENGKQGNVHPAVWVTMGVLFLAAAVLAILNYNTLAMIAGSGVVFAALAGILQKFGSFGSKTMALDGGRRFGKGPYTNAKAGTPEERTKHYAKIIEGLRKLAGERGWFVKWERIDTCLQKAKEAAAAGNHPLAWREYGQAIDHLNADMRQTVSTKASDSSVQL